MPDIAAPAVQSIGDLPLQTAATPANEAQARARFFNTGNAFNVILPPVPNMAFTDQPTRALSSQTPTSLIACYISDQLQCPFPATSPFVLAYYAKVKAGETLATNFTTTGMIGYVIQGSGAVTCGEETVNWGPGDLFVLPGGFAHNYTAGSEDAVVWLVANEPQLAFENLQSPAQGTAPTGVVHYPAAEIERQIGIIDSVGRNESAPGSALIFSSDTNEASRNALPTLTVAMNYLPPGITQRPHRHNSVAVSRVIRGENCFSTIDGKRKDWAPWCTTITPPVSIHSHSNHGDEQAMS